MIELNHLSNSKHMEQQDKQQLVDQFGRVHDYLRISLTDKCNLRCNYCMPAEGMLFKHTSELMSAEELLTFARQFVELGIRKIRLTGGEPLVRPDIVQIISELGKLPVELTMTTNGLIVDRYFDLFKESGLTTLNISLDSLKEEKFHSITRRNYLKKVMKNIHEALERGFHVKINNVVMKNVNEDEVLQFAEWTIDMPLDVRFIEYMPFKGNQWQYNKVVSYNDLLNTIESVHEIEMLKGSLNDTSRNFRIKNAKGNLGVISTITNPFCEGCNRIRLTADGKLKNCLFSDEETDLLSSLRKGDDYLKLLKDCISGKHFSRGGLKAFELKEAKDDYEKNRSMISIGG